MLEVQRTRDTMEPRYIETIKRMLQLNEWFSLQCYYTMYAIRPQYFRSPLVHFMTSWARCILWRRNKEEKCDVTLPWWQNFSISAIFLDRNGHLHCRTMEEKFGLPFCFWVQSCTGKSYLSMLSPYLRDHGLLRSRHSATMATWCNDLSALLRFCNREFKIRRLRSLVPSRPRRFRMWRHLSSLSGKFAYRAWFQASSGHSDSANRPGYEAGRLRTTNYGWTSVVFCL